MARKTDQRNDKKRLTKGRTKRDWPKEGQKRLTKGMGNGSNRRNDERLIEGKTRETDRRKDERD
jgi:hypothetical protein